MSSSRPESIEDLFQVLVEKGDSEYGGEKVTQLEHALQAAGRLQVAHLIKGHTTLTPHRGRR